MRRQRILTALLTVLLGAPVLAQSLADVAKKEEERRKEIKAPAKVITNKDLTPAPAASAPPPAAPATAAATLAADKDKDAKDQDGKDANDPKKDQAYWAGRKKALADALDRDQTYAEALQSRINALTRDFVNEADPVRRGGIERDRQKAVAEQARLKDQIEKDKKALADLDEEARRAGVPPGWLR
jgi:hypothetical protein